MELASATSASRLEFYVGADRFYLVENGRGTTIISLPVQPSPRIWLGIFASGAPRTL